MIFTDRVRALIKERGITQDQFNQDVGISKNTLSYWEKERRLPRPKKMQEIAEYFGCTVEYLTGEEDRETSDRRVWEAGIRFFKEQGCSVMEFHDCVVIERAYPSFYQVYSNIEFRSLAELSLWTDSNKDVLRKIIQPIDQFRAENLKKAPASSNNHELPVYGDVSAGIGINAEQRIIGWETASNEYDESEYFYLLVDGDSMSPEINDGDYVLVHSQETIENGQIAVVVVDGEGFVKKIELEEDHITLISINHSYLPRTFVGYEMNRVHIIGHVVEMKRKFR